MDVHPEDAHASAGAPRAGAGGCRAPVDAHGSIDAEVLDAGRVGAVASHAVGTDDIDFEAARARGVIVTNTPGVLTDATADLTWALLLACARHVVAGDRQDARGSVPGLDAAPAPRARAARRGARHRRHGSDRPGRRGACPGVRHDGHRQRLEGRPTSTRILDRRTCSPCMYAHAGERGLLGRDAIAKMKPPAIAINTARGAVVTRTRWPMPSNRENWPLRASTSTATSRARTRCCARSTTSCSSLTSGRRPSRRAARWR